MGWPKILVKILMTGGGGKGRAFLNFIFLKKETFKNGWKYVVNIYGSISKKIKNFFEDFIFDHFVQFWNRALAENLSHNLHENRKSRGYRGGQRKSQLLSVLIAVQRATPHAPSPSIELYPIIEILHQVHWLEHIH